VVVVGDAAACATPLEKVGRSVEAATPEF
jgi:hypothetical protein